MFWVVSVYYVVSKFDIATMGISLNKKCCRRELGSLLLLLVLELNPMTTWGSRLLHIEKPNSSSILDTSLNSFDVLSQGAVGDGQTDDSKVRLLTTHIGWLKLSFSITTLIIPIREGGLIVHVGNSEGDIKFSLRHEIGATKRSRKQCSPWHDLSWHHFPKVSVLITIYIQTIHTNVNFFYYLSFFP